MFNYLENYNPEWRYEFERIQVSLYSILKDFNVKIEHVGSTAVKGISARPFIDIDLVVEDNQKIPDLTEQLKKIGYSYSSDFSKITQYSFKAVSNNVPYTILPQTYMNHYIYILNESSEMYHDQIIFRDYLRKSKTARNKYELLKYRLLKRYGEDNYAYINAKSLFISQIINKLKVCKC